MRKAGRYTVNLREFRVAAFTARAVKHLIVILLGCNAFRRTKSIFHLPAQRDDIKVMR